MWNDRICYTFGDTNLLVEGMQQAQLVTKSMVVDGLPASVQQVIDNVKIPSQSDVFMQDIVRTSFLFQADQEKLPKRRNPDKPMYNFKRDYGITNLRRK